ncbi:MAG: TetR/AcrR family transcriptional regulator [Acidobacteria bacterium]|nr:TetR/AcrR family transcriptional regulator [Acidobacteriota bacterium]
MSDTAKEKKRETIIAAALQVFRRKGFNGATIAEIAVAAGIGKGTVYEYFPSKAMLIHEALLFLLRHIESIIFGIAVLRIPPADKLRRMIDAFSFLEQEGAMAELNLLSDYWAEAFRQGDSANIYTLEFKKSYENARRLFMDVIEEGMAKQEFRSDVRPELLAAAIVGMLDGLFLQWYLDRERVPYARVIDHFCTCLLRGIRPPSPPGEIV